MVMLKSQIRFVTLLISCASLKNMTSSRGPTALLQNV